MKECSREEVLKGKKSQYDPPYPSRSSVGPGGQRDQEHGVVLHDQEEGYQLSNTSRTESSQVPQGLSMTYMIMMILNSLRVKWIDRHCVSVSSIIIIQINTFMSNTKNNR